MTTTLDSLFLIRHARSQANDDPTLYLRQPDHAIALSRPEDDPAAEEAGRQLAALGIEPERVCAWTSPYLRCYQTMALVLRRAFGPAAQLIHTRESYLLREQEFGAWDGWSEDEMAQRDPTGFARRQLLSDQLGRFYFRYPNGESRADVAHRVVGFMGKIHRSALPVHLVFLHGVTQRALRMNWLNRSVVWFENEPNPANASVLQLHRQSPSQGTERYLT